MYRINFHAIIKRRGGRYCIIGFEEERWTGERFFFAFYILHMYSMHPTYNNNNNNKYIKQHKFACRVQRTDDWLVGSFVRSFSMCNKITYFHSRSRKQNERKLRTTVPTLPCFCFEQAFFGDVNGQSFFFLQEGKK